MKEKVSLYLAFYYILRFTMSKSFGKKERVEVEKKRRKRRKEQAKKKYN